METILTAAALASYQGRLMRAIDTRDTASVLALARIDCGHNRGHGGQAQGLRASLETVSGHAGSTPNGRTASDTLTDAGSYGEPEFTSGQIVAAVVGEDETIHADVHNFYDTGIVRPYTAGREIRAYLRICSLCTKGRAWNDNRNTAEQNRLHARKVWEAYNA